ncbi:MAG TPA: Hsp20/alpha crystallin family protein [Longimicrobiales bacterium]|jgi:HSP20 family protein|nr:Hsp20/alpha crystallin family protein [Longimicrobiales bacterium]
MTRFMTTWRPFREMDEFFRPFAPFFGQVPMLREFEKDYEAGWLPVTDIVELEKEYLVKVDLPDVKREDVQVYAEEGDLVIKGARKYERDVKDVKILRRETFYGEFERVFTLPEHVDVKAIKAECKDGVLRVHLPKLAVEAPKPLKITVQ